MTVRVIERLAVPHAPPAAREVRAALVGCGLSGAMLGALADRVRLDLIDLDLTELRQTIIPPLSSADRPKAALVRDYRRERFPWLGAERAFVAPAEALGDGYWRALAAAGGLVLACTDSIATQTHLARVARRHGLPMLATGLGPDAVELLIAPAAPGAACYGCLGRSPARAPVSCFFAGLDAAPVNGPAPPPTNSSLHLAALVAALAIAEAPALVAGAHGHTEIVSLTPGGSAVRARVAPRANCPGCAERPAPRTAVTALPHTSRDRFAVICDALGVPVGEAEAVVPGRAARALLCADCGRYTELPHFVLGRRVRCGACGGDAMMGADPIEPGARVPLEAARDCTPAALGWPWWPIIEIHAGRTRRFVELAGDAAHAGDLITIEPVLVGEPDA